MRREVALLLFPIFSASHAQKRGNFYFACTIWMLLYWASNFCGRVYGNPRFSKYINLIYYDKFRMTYKGDKLYFNYDRPNGGHFSAVIRGSLSSILGFKYTVSPIVYLVTRRPNLVWLGPKKPPSQV